MSTCRRGERWPTAETLAPLQREQEAPAGTPNLFCLEIIEQHITAVIRRGTDHEKTALNERRQANVAARRQHIGRCGLKSPQRQRGRHTRVVPAEGQKKCTGPEKNIPVNLYGHQVLCRLK